ncbi:MAG: hypothetical protein ABEN55_05100, partial [Bradymonadaceae bacterium]
MIPDGVGELHAAHDIHRGDERIRAAYGNRRTFVFPEFDEALAAGDSEDEVDSVSDDPAGDGVETRVAAFLDRLRVSTLTLTDLVDDLEDAPAAFVNEEDRRRRIVSMLAEAGGDLQRRAADLPLFRTIRGELSPRAADGSDRSGVVLPAEGPAGRQLAELYRHHRPVAATDDPDAVRLLRQTETPVLDVDQLLDDLERTGPVYEKLTGDAESRRVLHETLEHLHGRLSARHFGRLAELDIWPDAEGTLRPLTGDRAALVPDDTTIVDLFPDAPWLHPAHRRHEHVGDIVDTTVGPSWVVGDLAGEGTGVLARNDGPLEDAEYVERLATYLVERLEQIPKSRAEQLPTLPLYLDRDRRVGRLADDIGTPEATGILV